MSAFFATDGIAQGSQSFQKNPDIFDNVSHMTTAATYVNFPLREDYSLSKDRVKDNLANKWVIGRIVTVDSKIAVKPKPNKDYDVVRSSNIQAQVLYSSKASQLLQAQFEGIYEHKDNFKSEPRTYPNLITTETFARNVMRNYTFTLVESELDFIFDKNLGPGE
ncbi:MAG: hypothetical protein WBG71_04005 [Leeuwenhoekiella sp.]